MNYERLIQNILTREGFESHFQGQFLEQIPASTLKVAVLATNEYEGFSKNGGIGSYYTTLSQQLKEEGWYVILLLCQSNDTFGGTSYPPVLEHVFSTHELDQVLALQPIHQELLEQAQRDPVGQWFDYESLCCLFFTQAIVEHCKDAVVYVEFPVIWGFGYRTIQAKRCGVLGTSCLVGVTSHGGFEWLRETNGRYLDDNPRWLWQAYHYEQLSYENADITFFPSHFLRSKVESYGWNTERAYHQPYFIPHLNVESEPKDHPILSELQPTWDTNKIPVVFFGRLEERKGLCIFVEAVQALEPAIANQIQLLFLGKSVWLQSPALKHLQSHQYIAETFGEQIPYRILTDLSSHDALQLIHSLVHPIVCLTSLQENFPNTALEIGQLPFRLVVSDTGGFRETLGLVERCSGVEWFSPGDAHALAHALTKTIADNVEPPERLNSQSRDHINQRLLEQRLEFMSEAFLEGAPKEPKTPSVTVGVTCLYQDQPLLDCLESLANQSYQNFDVVVLYPDVDHASVPECISAAQSQHPNYQFIGFTDNLTLGRVHNLLLEKASGEFILPFSANHIALPFMVEQFANAANEANASVVLSPQVHLKDGHLQVVNLMDGPLLKILEFSYSLDVCALLSTAWLQEMRYAEIRDIKAVNWQVVAAAIATGQEIAYYPYPLYLAGEHPESIIHPSTVSKERYYLQHYLSKIDRSQWTQRQLHLLLTGVEQLAQTESQAYARIWALEQERDLHQSQTQTWMSRSQAWMQTAQQLQEEISTKLASGAEST